MSRASSLSSRQVSAAINVFLIFALALNVAFWAGGRSVFLKWQGVPTPPSRGGAVTMALGDTEFAFRSGALMLQNLGDENGQITNLREYNFQKLESWFWLLNSLDPASDHVPLVAAYYFGATEDPAEVAHVVNYLGQIGQNPVGNKWRWLAQAVMLARHHMNNLDVALQLANKLSNMQPVGDTLPHWAREMPAFVLTAKGDKEDARKLLEELLINSDRFHPNEVNFMEHYLITQLGMSKEDVMKIMQKRQKPVIEDLPMAKDPVEPR